MGGRRGDRYRRRHATAGGKLSLASLGAFRSEASSDLGRILREAAKMREADARKLEAAAARNLVERFDIEPFPDFFIQMSKLYRARALLYRRQILQANIRWKALDEIYKICMLLHRSKLKILAEVC